MEQISKITDFINKCNIIHNNKYDYTNSVYINSLTKIKFVCKKHNILISMLPGNHKAGKGCILCAKEKLREKFSSNKEEFINKALLIHGNKYKYDFIEYVNAKTKVIITCKEHDNFEQTPDSHLSGKGCNQCRNKKVSELNTKTLGCFIKQSNILHNNKYNYNKSVYINDKTKLMIECPLHGEFLQSPGKHLSNRGCKKCANIATSNYQKENPNGWKLNYWMNKAKTSKIFDSYKIYLIRCWNEEEEFYKIGRTFSTVAHRFKSHNTFPYNYELLREIINTPEYVYETEHLLKNKYKQHKYIPRLKFSGMQECFKFDKTTIDEFNI